MGTVAGVCCAFGIAQSTDEMMMGFVMGPVVPEDESG